MMHFRIVVFIVWVLFFLPATPSAETGTGDDEGMTLFLAGDTILTQPWSHVKEPEFLRLIDEIRQADAAIVNLETVIHEFKGYAQAHSGGIHLVSPPKVALDLAWAGVDMVGHANNHTFDYGSIGVLENLEHTEKAGLVLAGSGKDLQNALAPRYYKHPKGTVGLVAASSSFLDYGKASYSRVDMRGRPGLNPVARDEKFLSVFVTITPSMASLMQKFSKAIGFAGGRFARNRFILMGMEFKVGEENSLSFGTGGYFHIQGMEANLAAVREAKKHADVVVFSIHAHQQGKFLQRLAYDILDAGADVFLAHGPHEIRGIEFYKGKPIFYSLGDFVYQTRVDRLPVETFEKNGLDKDAPVEDVKRAMEKMGKYGFQKKREVWEGVTATLRFQKGRVSEIKLLPVDLGFQKPLSIRGRPQYAAPALGKHIIGYTAKQSQKYGTKIQYKKEGNFGLVQPE